MTKKVSGNSEMVEQKAPDMSWNNPFEIFSTKHVEWFMDVYQSDYTS